MKRQRFPLSSDQLELLKEFEHAGSLEALADKMAKDPSVISRRLQNLSATVPALTKEAGRWKINYLGRQINQLSQKFLIDLDQLVATPSKTFSKPQLIQPHSALLVINAQKALHYSEFGRRNNLKAEENILRLLKHWRKKSWPIAHVKHISQTAASPFYIDAETSEFITGFEPVNKERVFEKNKPSAFSNSKLRRFVKSSPGVVLVGFTAGECIDATAKDAKDLQLDNFVVSDATASFDLVGANRKIVRAEKIHQTVLAQLHNSVSTVVDTDSIL